MKKYFVFPLLIMCLFFQNCETGFKVSSEWKEITIAYGILNSDDTDHFIRIQKAFLDETTSALKIASIADSLYHDGDLFVELDVYRNGVQIMGDTLEVVEGIDFDLEKHQDENTVFGNDPFLLYHSDLEIPEGTICRLKITTPKGTLLSSEVELINDFTIWRPLVDRDVNLCSKEPYTRWDRPDEGAVYGLAIRLYYTEEINGLSSQTELMWSIADILPITTNERALRYDFNIKRDNPVSQVSEYTNEFFDFLAKNIEVNNFASRSVDSLQFIYTFGSQSMFDYNQVLAAQQQSIAGGGQGINPYSNIENGLGLFASRSSKIIYDLELDNETKDSLFCSPITQALNFKAATPDVRCK